MITLQYIEIGYKTTLFSIENIQLKKGYVYALIGANGAGKTTFLQSLTGFNQSIKGEVVVSNKSIYTFSRLDKAKTISFVASKFDGIDYLKVIDYISLGRIPYTNALGRLTDYDKELVNESIRLLNLEVLSEKYTIEISDGERQLVAIARALTQQTEVIILDEPTAFLDYSNRKKVMETMKDIAIKLNKCIIISSHDLELCLESNTQLLVIHKARKAMILFDENTLTKEKLISIGF